LKEVRAVLESEAEHSVLNMSAGGGGIGSIQVLAIPRGAMLDVKSGTITVEGETVAELPSIEPFTPTPALLTDQTHELVAEPPTIDLEAEPAVTRLDTWRSRRREDDPPGVV
jgi:hypothetical protein